MASLKADEYTPSHPNFDRSNLSDNQYIEQLIFENRELKSIIDKQNKIIENLSKQISPITPVTERSSSLTDFPVPRSPFRSSYSPTKSYTHSHSQPSLPPPKEEENNDNKEEQEEDNEENSLEDIPMRSSRRRRNSTEPKRTPPFLSLDKAVIPNESSLLARKHAYQAGDQDKEDNEDDDEEEEEEENDSGSVAESDDEDPNLSKITTIDNTFIDSTLESVDSNKMEESQFSTRSPTESTTTTVASSARMYTQSKGLTRSASSIGSTYKSSRIKPPTAVGNIPPLQKKQSVDDLAPPNSLKAVVASINSPVESRSPQSQYETPPSQSNQIFTSNDQLAPPYEINTANGSASATTLETITSNTRPTLTLPTNSNYSAHTTPSSIYQSTDTVTTPKRPSLQSPTRSSLNVHTPRTPSSSFNVLHTPKADMDESSLFIKPDDFQTIFICVVSTITVNSLNQTTKKSDDPNITITINDRDTEKEMWKIRKSYSQLISFDQEIRPIVEYFGLSPIPEKQLFFSSTPAKIETRRSAMQNYFNSIFQMPHIPRMVVYNICKFLSLDFVNPLDDFKSGARKEGFLVRRYKGLGTTWKVRWCQVDGPYMEIFENPGGAMLEQIRLTGAQIGRQSTDSVAEDKGYRHAFLVMECPNTSKKIHSSTPKHFFCAETDFERDDWVTALIEFTDPSCESNPTSPVRDNSQIMATVAATPNSKHDEEVRSISNGYTPSSTSDSLGSATMDDSKRHRKRSYFSFRNRTSSVVNDTAESISSPAPPLPESSPPPPPQSTNDLQHVLSQMNLGEEVIPNSIFGKDLHEAYELSNTPYHGKPVPSICFRCLDFLEKTHAIYEEGLFRISGRKAIINELQHEFDTKLDIDLFECGLSVDIPTIAGLLKLYLRMLPSPIIRLDQEDFSSIELVKHKLHEDEVCYNMICSIFLFLHQVIVQSRINKMNLRNICIVFEPTLNVSSEVISFLLDNFNEIFVH
ncbi:LOW QUALITY PROTEIN: BEM3 GTPase-activating protein BEM3 [Candida maltosa Xu316]